MPAADRSIAELLASLCDETISPAEMKRLDHLLCTDAAVRRLYLEYLDIHARLNCRFRPASESQESGIGDQESDAGAAVEPVVGAAVELPHQPGESSDPETLIPPIIIDTTGPLSSPFFSFPSSVGGWLFSYAAATVITGMAILGAWAYKVSHDDQLVTTPIRRRS